MASDPLACETCPVRDRAACAALDARERGELARLGIQRTLKRGETLFRADSAGDQCATLISGALKISQVDSAGDEHILSLVHPAGFVGELFAQVPRHDVVALTESRVCVFPRHHYEEVVERFPALGRALLRRSSEEVFAGRALIAMMSRKSARARVSGLLMGMAQAASGSPCHPAASFDLPLTRGEVAALLGLTIETVSRQLTGLEKEGIIRRNGARGIELVDAARLGTEAA